MIGKLHKFKAEFFGTFLGLDVSFRKPYTQKNLLWRIKVIKLNHQNSGTSEWTKPSDDQEMLKLDEKTLSSWMVIQNSVRKPLGSLG